jgi:Ser/Thr protein kinase RdoA (MazF antagonist)
MFKKQHNRLRTQYTIHSINFVPKYINMIGEILREYGLTETDCKIEKYGSGLINETWLVKNNEEKYILQKINDAVIQNPQDIADNIELIDQYLQRTHKDYFFTSPLKTITGKTLLHLKGNGYYRMFPFVKNSHSFDVVETPDQAYEAAKQFGRFTRLLSPINVSQIKITIPSFHDLSFRYHQYQQALQNGNEKRIAQSQEMIHKLDQYIFIVDEYEAIKKNPDFKLRVTHHDTKISNILFDENNKGICVIDLDTVMPGYFISDVGDMMRTYLSPVSEEEKDFGKIEIRDEFYKAIVKGYLEEMEDELTETEKKYFFYSGIFIIYTQALRFLTDHLNNDIYYGAKYPDHNFVRAENQLTLLEKLMGKKDILDTISIR